MAKVLIIGGGGMVGQKLSTRLAEEPLGDADEVTLFDMVMPENGAPAAHQVLGNVTDRAAFETLLKARPDVIYYLVAIVSGEAETDFDLGWSVNMTAFATFLDVVRKETETGDAYKPKIVFTSSIAVFGAPFPEKIDDTFFQAPLTSYGAQKAMSELMLSDYIRKGFVDGVSIRLPTICVRPGKANKAASSFFSGIIREPLNGLDAILPVSDEVRHWHASPRTAAGFLRHAATLDQAVYENRPALNMPGVSCTVAEQIEALREIAGNDVVARIRPEPDPAVIAIVKNWPRNFAPERSKTFGFTAEERFHDIIRVYLNDDFTG